MRRTALLAVAALLAGACATSGTADPAADAPTAGTAQPCQHTAREVPVPVAAAPERPGPFPWDDVDAVAVDDLDTDEIIPGGPPPDGIRPIDDPCVVGVAAVDWLADEESLLVVEAGGEVRGYPLQIMTQHEIVNDVLGGEALTVTYCPLCNSGLAFDRTVDGEAWDFGTSGRLLRSNLVMYDRQTRTLWSQFGGEALWGDADVVGRTLERLPTQLLGWATFRTTFPEATVLDRDSFPGRSYGRNPYPGYEGAGSGFLFRGDTDARLDPDARVVGLGPEGAAVAVPLERLREQRSVTVEVDGDAVTVVWAPGQASALDGERVADGVEVGQTGAFLVDRLEPDGDGRFVDPTTGAVHDVTGRVVDGGGPDLVAVPLDDTFWFVWFAFRPSTSVATG